MEGYVCKTIRLEEIQSSYPYSCRYRPLEATSVLGSIQKRGIVFPLLATRGPERLLISGHRRLAAAKSLGLREIKIWEIVQTQNPSELFLISVLSNWNQAWSDLDRAWVIRKAKEEFKFSQQDLLEGILPALGLSSESYLLNQYYDVACLEPCLLDLVEAGRLPFRGMQILGKFLPEDRATFATLIGSKIILTSNQLLKAGEWLYDLLKKEKTNLGNFLKDRGLLEILNRQGNDEGQKARAFYNALRRLRFPRLAESEQKVEKVLTLLAPELKELRLEMPESFEEEGFSLHAKLKSQASIEQLKEFLSKHRPQLNSLFDIML